MRNIVFLAIIGICIGELILLPILSNGFENSGDIEITEEAINDLKVRRLIYRKGIFDESGDVHWFKVALKQDVVYIARMKFTALYSGTFFVAVYGVTTSTFYFQDIVTPVTNYKIETNYTADGTATGTVQVIYTPVVLDQEFPTYSLYFNKAGFAGWWWIALSGIGALAVLIFIFTFMIIGMISVSKNRSKKKKRKK
jgi:hypothetical protein